MGEWLRMVGRRLRDTGELRDMFASVAVGYLAMEFIGQVAGPLPPTIFSLGVLALTLLILYGLVPVLRRGRWRR